MKEHLKLKLRCLSKKCSSTACKTFWSKCNFWPFTSLKEILAPFTEMQRSSALITAVLCYKLFSRIDSSLMYPCSLNGYNRVTLPKCLNQWVFAQYGFKNDVQETKRHWNNKPKNPWWISFVKTLLAKRRVMSITTSFAELSPAGSISVNLILMEFVTPAWESTTPIRMTLVQTIH